MNDKCKTCVSYGGPDTCLNMKPCPAGNGLYVNVEEVKAVSADPEPEYISFPTSHSVEITPMKDFPPFLDDYEVYGNGEVTTDGLKYDAGKVDMTFLNYFPRALTLVCGLSAFGADKYSRGGFRAVQDPNRYKAAMLRHYFKEEVEDVDPDSGFAHDVAVAWNALAALEIRLMNDE